MSPTDKRMHDEVLPIFGSFVKVNPTRTCTIWGSTAATIWDRSEPTASASGFGKVESNVELLGELFEISQVQHFAGPACFVDLQAKKHPDAAVVGNI